MNQGKYVFAQLMEFLPKSQFDYIVNKYNGNKHIRTFSCWNQLLVMLFGQLSARESLRDTITSIQAHSAKCYHLGLGRNVYLPTVASANEKRDYRIFEEFATILIQKARTLRKDEPFDLPIKGNVYAFDSSTISLCLSLFPWARFKYEKSAVKLHTQYDVRTNVPSLVVVTPASVNDMRGMDFLNIEYGSYYIFDRGYNDYARLYTINQRGGYMLKSEKSIYNILQILSISLLDKTPINQLLNNIDYKQTSKPDCNLLLFN